MKGDDNFVCFLLARQLCLLSTYLLTRELFSYSPLVNTMARDMIVQDIDAKGESWNSKNWRHSAVSLGNQPLPFTTGFYLYLDRQNQLWVSVEGGCEGVFRGKRDEDRVWKRRSLKFWHITGWGHIVFNPALRIIADIIADRHFCCKLNHFPLQIGVN